MRKFANGVANRSSACEIPREGCTSPDFFEDKCATEIGGVSNPTAFLDQNYGKLQHLSVFSDPSITEQSAAGARCFKWPLQVQKVPNGWDECATQLFIKTSDLFDVALTFQPAYCSSHWHWWLLFTENHRSEPSFSNVKIVFKCSHHWLWSKLRWNSISTFLKNRRQNCNIREIQGTFSSISRAGSLSSETGDFFGKLFCPWGSEKQLYRQIRVIRTKDYAGSVCARFLTENLIIANQIAENSHCIPVILTPTTSCMTAKLFYFSHS